MIHLVVHEEHDSAGAAVVEGVSGRLTAAGAPGHREFVLTRLYESAGWGKLQFRL